jgi:3-methyladenine DNA glycosylase AlkD
MFTQEIKELFLEAANKEEAKGMAAYMKNNFPFLGIKKPIRAEILKQYFIEAKKYSSEEILQVAKEIWALPEREYQYTSIELLVKAKRKWTPAYFDFFELMLCDKSWWDSVDAIATKLIGEYVFQHKNTLEARMKEYAVDPNLWRRRTSIIFQLFYRDECNIELLFEHIVLNKKDPEFFIQKAIGWSLRQISEQHPDLVRDFVEEQGLKGLARREALRIVNC